MQFTCQVCGTPANINENMGTASCTRCGAIFNFAQPSVVPIPAGISVYSEGNDHLIIRRWFRPVWISFFVGGLFGILLGIYVIPMMFPSLSPGERYGIFVPFLVPFAFCYAGLLHIINRTEIRINRQWIDIRHVPLPFAKGISEDARRITKIYYDNTLVSQPRAYTQFSVWMELTNRESQQLLDDITSRTQAEFIVKEIEKVLGLATHSITEE